MEKQVENEQIKIIRSSRKTLAVQVRGTGLIVRAPYDTDTRQIRDFLQKHQRWIDRHLQKAKFADETAQHEGMLTNEDIQKLADQAKAVIPGRVSYFASLMGVSYGRITIRCQRSRWGSCTSKGNLNFNCLLMLAPPEVLDSVVVHELAHRKEMNHSDRFYRVIREVYPDYNIWNQWLKKNGRILLRRIEQ